MVESGDHKNQHYVPRHYLKAWAEDSLLQSFPLARGEAYPEKIGDVCARNYFYGNPPVVETKLQRVERLQQIPLKKLRTREDLIDLDSDDLKLLLSFITTQRSRTKAAKEDIRSGEDFLRSAVEEDFAADRYEKRLTWKSEFTKSEKAESIVDASLLGTHYYVITLGIFGHFGIQDLAGVLLCNLTDTDFIISDAPIVLDNPRYKPENGAVPAGLANRGLQIFCPISPHRLLLLYDREVYDFTHNSRRQLLLKDSESVDQINLLQFHNAQDVVLFADNDEEYIRTLHSDIDEVRRRDEITMPLETESMETEYVDKTPAYQAPKISPDLPDYRIMNHLPFAQERPEHQSEGREIVHDVFDKYGYPDVSLLAAIELFEKQFDTES